MVDDEELPWESEVPWNTDEELLLGLFVHGPSTWEGRMPFSQRNRLIEWGMIKEDEFSPEHFVELTENGRRLALMFGMIGAGQC